MKRVSLVLVILAVLVGLSLSSINKGQDIAVKETQETNKVIEFNNPGVKALKHLEVLSNEIGQRGNGSENEKKAAGIPYAYFEATNWELGDLDGYTQTENHGQVWHTEKDTLEFIETEFEGRVEERLSTFVQVLANVLVEIKEKPTSLVH